MNDFALTVEELAQRLKISRPKAYELVRHPNFPTLRIGRRIIVPVDGLDAWVRANTGGWPQKEGLD